MTVVLRRQLWEVDCKLDMTPLIDCTFLLLIFFLCTIRFKQTEGELKANLPRDVGVNRGTSEPVQRVDIVIELVRPGEPRDPGRAAEPWSGEGRFQLVGHEVRYWVGPRSYADLEAVEKRLTELHRADPERPLSIRPATGVVMGDIVPLLDASVRAGFTDVSFRA